VVAREGVKTTENKIQQNTTGARLYMSLLVLPVITTPKKVFFLFRIEKKLKLSQLHRNKLKF
jgi:hypothetical protein